MIIVFADGSWDSTTSHHGIGVVIGHVRGMEEIDIIHAFGYPVIDEKSNSYEIELTAMYEAISYVRSSGVYKGNENDIVFLTDNKWVSSRFKDPHGVTNFAWKLCYDFAVLLENNTWAKGGFYTNFMGEIDKSVVYYFRNMADGLAKSARKTMKVLNEVKITTPQVMRPICGGK